MKSRIQIDIDHDNQPIIKIEYSPSGDVRDTMVKRFLETFGSNSCFAQFRYVDQNHGEVLNSVAIIRPISQAEFEEEAKTMDEQLIGQ